MGFRLSWRWAASAAVLCVSCSGVAGTEFPFGSDADGVPSPQPTRTPPEPVDPDVGNGQSGNVTVDDARVVNECVQVLEAYGQEVRTVEPAPFSPGERILLLQVQDEFAVLGDAADVDAPGDAGRWELPRVDAVDGLVLHLESALTFRFVSDAGRRAQACSVPEYGELTVGSLGQVRATPWNGHRGGVVAVLATGTVTVNGSIRADGSGFRGGVASTPGDGDPVFALGTAPEDGGGKGEGLDGVGWDRHGRGNFANGAGGGNSSRAGGGGGGGGGAGGAGGRNLDFDDDTAGAGGATVLLPARERLTFGGGGGGGHQAEANGSLAGAGGAGGGVVLIFAGSFAGGGTIQALGGNGGEGGSPDVVNGGDGAGGGGGGGTIRLWSAGGGSFQGALIASGGNGGHVRTASAGSTVGPGGGGGGGRVVLDGLAADVAVNGGEAGANVDLGAGDNAWGATEGVEGIVE